MIAVFHLLIPLTLSTHSLFSGYALPSASFNLEGQGLVKECALVQAAIGCRILLLLVPKMVLALTTCADGVFPVTK